MATHDYIIANASGAAVRADLNNALAAIVSNNSNATSPATTYSYQWWADTTANQLKLRNAANDDWIVIQELDGTMLIEDGTAAAPGLAFTDDVNTGLIRNSADNVSIVTGGTQAITVDSSQRVGIGTASPAAAAHIEGATPYIRAKQTAAPADEKTWDFNAGTDGILRFRNTNDAADSSNNWLEVERSGVETGSIRFLAGAGSEKVRILSGGGITFNGDTAAANALDDYEEGSWTPVFAGGTTSGTYTYTNQLGRYTKIGDQVVAYCALTDITTVGAGTGAIRIKGLPFTSSAESVFAHGVCRLNDFNVSSSAYDLNVTVNASSTQCSIVICRVNLTASSVQSTGKNSNNSDIFFTVTYRVA